MAKVEERVDELLSKIEEIEKKLKIAERIPEARKIVDEIREQIPSMREIVSTIGAARKEFLTKVLPEVKEALPKLSNLIKALEDKETVINLKFNKLNITIDGEKSLSITLLKTKKVQ